MKVKFVDEHNQFEGIKIEVTGPLDAIASWLADVVLRSDHEKHQVEMDSGAYVTAYNQMRVELNGGEAWVHGGTAKFMVIER